MKKLFKLLVAAAICLGFTYGLALAGNARSISASCTIPAIPGVNAPLLAEKNDPTTDNVSQDERSENADYEEDENAPPIIVEQENEIVLAQNGSEYSAARQTIYLR